MIKKLAILATFSVVFGAAHAQDLTNDALKIGKEEFFLDELVELVFDETADYRELLGCDTILMEQKKPDGGLNSACVTSNGVMFISTSMTTGNRVGSAYVCPQNQSQSSVDRLIALSFDSKPLGNGTVYHLGYTDGWRHDYVNRLALLDISGQTLGCWDIGRR